jgi:GDPmannose 4,6-dehydratase
VEAAFGETGTTLRWEGSGVSEKGICTATGKVLVEVDPRYFRPTEVDVLVGDASKARKHLAWAPQCGFKQLVKEMVCQDLEAVSTEINTKQVADSRLRVFD